MFIISTTETNTTGISIMVLRIKAHRIILPKGMAAMEEIITTDTRRFHLHPLQLRPPLQPPLQLSPLHLRQHQCRVMKGTSWKSNS